MIPTMDRTALMRPTRQPEPVFSYLSEQTWDRLHGVRSAPYLRGAMVRWLA